MEERNEHRGPLRDLKDPTELTTDAVNAAREQWRLDLESLKQLIGTRLDAMDTATNLRLEHMGKFPMEIVAQVQNLKELHEERFDSVLDRIDSQDKLSANQFKERDVRSEREARDNKLAVDAAFAAQEKQAVAQNEGNNLAINKSELATAETIKTNQELNKSEVNSLRKSHEDSKVRQTEVDDDMKKRLGAVEATFSGMASSSRVGAVEAQMVGLASRTQGSQEQRVENRAGSTMIWQAAAVIASVLIAAISLAAFFLKP